MRQTRRERSPGVESKASRCRWAVVGVLALAVCPGCALNRPSLRNGAEGSPAHQPDRGTTPTLGTDPNTVPPGQTIPAAGLGVDLS